MSVSQSVVRPRSRAKPCATPAKADALKTFDDLAAYPDLFAMVCDGVCMSPLVKDDEHVLIDKRAKIKPGDLVCFFLRPELVRPGVPQASCKRLVLNMMPGVTYPYVPHPNSNVMPILIVEQVNPPRQYQLPATALMAVWKASKMPENAVFDPASELWRIPNDPPAKPKASRKPLSAF